MDTTTPKPRGTIIRNIYLYLVSFVALMMLIFSTADLINIALKTFIFTKADNNFYYPVACPALPPDTTSTDKNRPDCTTPDQQKQNDDNRIAQRQQSLVRDISLILVAIPVFAYHWRIIRKKEEGA